MAEIMVPEPFPISLIANRYLLFDVDTITYARRVHNICGVLIGSLPHLSQQNIFLGVPLELMPEEARVLVEQGHAYIVDDVSAHKDGLLNMSREDRLAFLQLMDKQGMEISLNNKKKAEERSEKVLKEKGLARIAQENQPRRASATPATEADDENSLFDSSPGSASPAPSTIVKVDPHFITPTTSHPPLPTPPVTPTQLLPKVPHTYPLFAYLHSQGFFATPGLRFGCHYTVYPGDPLRFHSHFLTTGLEWDEEFDLLDIVGGGRLGTGVKKAYLIGGEDPSTKSSENDEQIIAAGSGVRAFSIEWAGL